MSDPQILIEYTEDANNNIKIIVPDDVEETCKKADSKWQIELDEEINDSPEIYRSYQNKKVENKCKIIELDCQIKSSNDRTQNEYFSDSENTFTNNSNIFVFTEGNDVAYIDYIAQQENSKIFEIIVPKEIQREYEIPKDPKKIELSFDPQLKKGNRISVKFKNRFKGAKLISKEFVSLKVLKKKKFLE